MQQCCRPARKCFYQYQCVLNQENEKTLLFIFSRQYPHPPLRRLSFCVLAPLTWSSSSTPTLSWEMALLSGRRLSIVPASLHGQRCMESTWSPISCGTWIQTQSITSACCWLDRERAEPALRDLLSWAGPSVQVTNNCSQTLWFIRAS